MTTTTNNNDLRETINNANPNQLPDALAQVGIGNVLSSIKATFAALASAAAHDVTSAASKAAATIVGATLETGENLPAIGNPIAVRVTAGAAAAGLRQIGDSGAAPSATVATLSDDGKTLTFEAGVTAFVLYYSPRSRTALTTAYPTQGTGA